MTHPFRFIHDGARKPLFWSFLLAALILFAIFRPLDKPLITPAAPSGMVSFELAHTPANALAIIDSWDTRAQLYAAFGLGFDFLFLPVYALALSLGSLLAAGRHPGWFSYTGSFVCWGVILAASLDAVENIALWNSLLGTINSDGISVAYWCASFKFGLILMGILYGVVGWLWPKKSRV
jgi:hypothetical protein